MPERAKRHHPRPGFMFFSKQLDLDLLLIVFGMYLDSVLLKNVLNFGGIHIHFLSMQISAKKHHAKATCILQRSDLQGEC